MSNCKRPMESYGETIGKLNETNRRLRAVSREMYRCLLSMPSGWEDETHHIKHFKDELQSLGVEL